MNSLAKVIDEKIRPSLQAHNGDIELVGVTSDGFVQIKLTGACSTCPGAQHTITEFIECEIKDACPEIKGVQPVFQVNDELIDMALKILRKDNDRNVNEH
ncbi:NifU family protein [Dendrosporobacter sp. 1207_IL3150]|uniref:NifU family protein n=1 Tax=Dendrosporobacter sp. 1207_IL3150 TaxID=3084054 RepID=UPI002FD98FD6